MVLKKALFLLLTVLSLQTTYAQADKGLKDKETMRKTCQSVVDLMGNDDVSGAFDVLRDVWYLPADELNYLEKQTIEQLNMVEPRFGAFIGNKLVKEEEVEGVLYRLFYVIKYEMHGIRVQFIFYNGKGGQWYLNNFKWDDSLGKLFDD